MIESAGHGLFLKYRFDREEKYFKKKIGQFFSDRNNLKVKTAITEVTCLYRHLSLANRTLVKYSDIFISFKLMVQISNPTTFSNNIFF